MSSRMPGLSSKLEPKWLTGLRPACSTCIFTPGFVVAQRLSLAPITPRLLPQVLLIVAASHLQQVLQESFAPSTPPATPANLSVANRRAFSVRNAAAIEFIAFRNRATDQGPDEE